MLDNEKNPLVILYQIILAAVRHGVREANAEMVEILREIRDSRQK